LRLSVLAVGKLKSGPERDLTDDYLMRAQSAARALGFRQISESEVASGGGLEAEGGRLLERLPKGARLIRLDEAGENLSSERFATRLASWRDAGEPDVVFIIGGAEGFHDSVRQAVPNAIAFGLQTWPHRLVRVMLAEQIYRAMTILAGTPYHKV
jgi:23S rRNA (pseudouridine1915-N3)-methyltransferase